MPDFLKKNGKKNTYIKNKAYSGNKNEAEFVYDHWSECKKNPTNIHYVIAQLKLYNLEI